MITIHIGGLGSGKTASVVKQIAHDKSNRLYFSNIKTPLKNCVQITPEMIVLKTPILNDKGKQVIRQGRYAYTYKLNSEFWEKDTRLKNVVIDECHTLMNPRRSSSSVNVVVSDWIALLRRALGEDSTTQAELILITQLIDRVDILVRSLCNKYIYHRCHYIKECLKCHFKFREHNDFAELIGTCPRCNHWQLRKYNLQIESWHFRSLEAFELWHELGEKTYHMNYITKKGEIEKYFALYNSWSWENMFSTLY